MNRPRCQRGINIALALIMVAVLSMLATPRLASADANWSGHTVNGVFDGARSVYATDVDSDGDIDVLGTAYLDNDIAWWENTTPINLAVGIYQTNHTTPVTGMAPQTEYAGQGYRNQR